MKKWLLVMRAPFLVLTPMLAFMGTAIAWWYDDAFNLGYALLAFAGMLLAHISVNVLNEYFDYRSGVDLETIKTPFSGGSGVLPAGLLKPNQALWLGLVSFLLIIPIGIFFVIEVGWGLLPLLLIAAACIVLYVKKKTGSSDIAFMPISSSSYLCFCNASMLTNLPFSFI